MQIVQHATSHCIMTFEKSFRSSHSIAHKKGRKVIYVAYSRSKCIFSCFFLLHAALSTVITHVVIFNRDLKIYDAAGLSGKHGHRATRTRTTC